MYVFDLKADRGNLVDGFAKIFCFLSYGPRSLKSCWRIFWSVEWASRDENSRVGMPVMCANDDNTDNFLAWLLLLQAIKPPVDMKHGIEKAFEFYFIAKVK